MNGIVHSSSSSKNVSSVSKTRFDDNSIIRFIQSQGLYNRKDEGWYDKFCRFGFVDPYNTIGGTKEYIFITKPDLHLFQDKSPSVLNKELEGIPFFKEAIRRYPEVMKQLQISHTGNKSPFMNILSNAITSSMDLSSISSDTNESAANYQGFSVKYREESFESDMNHSFSLEITDSRYLECYMLFKIYDMYERVKKDGDVTPPSDKYIYNRILHDQSAIYKFIVDDDGETILFYAKGIGVFPKNVPREVFGNLSPNSELSFSIDYNCTLLRDMDPLILDDFNNLTKPYFGKNSNIPVWNEKYELVDGRWANIPYIDTSEVINKTIPDISPIPRYKLKWR